MNGSYNQSFQIMLKVSILTIKKYKSIFFGILIFTLMVISFLIMIKPRARVFYLEKQIPAKELNQSKKAFEYRFTSPGFLFDPESALVTQDGEVLSKSLPGDPESGTPGTFAIVMFDTNNYSVLFTPNELAQPKTTAPKFHLLFHPQFISSKNARVVLLFLSISFIIFLASNWTTIQNNIKINTHFSKSLQRISDFFNRIGLNTPIPQKPRYSILKSALISTVLLSFLLAFMEWLFLITKPSFMSYFGFGEKIKILLITGLGLAIIFLSILFVIFIIDLVLSRLFPKLHQFAYYLPAALISASLILLLVDNFTYTIFNFGIIELTPSLRVIYAFTFVFLIYYFYRKLASNVSVSLKTWKSRWPGVLAAFLLGISLLTAVISIQILNNTDPNVVNSDPASKKPNIILFGTDGLNAQNMSVYEYDRDTTPFIKELAKTSLVGENHFSNASRTMGSTVSFLTGKSPLSTRVLYPPDILGGKDMYQHLPGILKANGYTTVSLGVPYYVDPNAVNFKDAFDSVNCRDNVNREFFNGLSKIGLFSENYFLNNILGRIEDRLLHIIFIKDMINPYQQLINHETEALYDNQRMRCLFSFLGSAIESDKPLFAHLHLMGTAGPHLNPSVRFYSKGQTQSSDWMTDFYDDTVLSYDQQVASLVEYLKSHGEFENTIIIIFTDHGEEHQIHNTLPLIIHFPGDEHAGVINVNTQNLDIAPTILDYLNIKTPSWMEGDSLLQALDPYRLIISTEPTPFEDVNGRSVIQKSSALAPFYQFGKISIFQCQNITIFDLKDHSISESIINNHTSPCPPENLLSRDELTLKLMEFLKSKGFDVPAKW